MSRQTSAGLDARRVVSTSPCPAIFRPLPVAARPTTSISAVAASCGRWLMSDIRRSCSSAVIVVGCAPRPVTKADRRLTASRTVRSAPHRQGSRRIRRWREDPGPSVEQSRRREFEAAARAAAQRMTADERHGLRQRRGGADDRPLGPADVGDHRCCRGMRRHALEQDDVLADGSGKDDRGLRCRPRQDHRRRHRSRGAKAPPAAPVRGRQRRRASTARRGGRQTRSTRQSARGRRSRSWGRRRESHETFVNSQRPTPNSQTQSRAFFGS